MTLLFRISLILLMLGYLVFFEIVMPVGIPLKVFLLGFGPWTLDRSGAFIFESFFEIVESLEFFQKF